MRVITTKQGGKRLFSYILNTSIAFMLIIGNSSYTIITKGQSKDSLRPIFSVLEPNNDGSKSIHISIPSKKMIRRADAEIRRNMHESVEITRKTMFAPQDYSNGDREMSINFKNNHNIPINISGLDDGDLFIDLSFKAENIEFDQKENLDHADKAIHRDFLRSYHISTGDQSNYLHADSEITTLFYNENH